MGSPGLLMRSTIAGEIRNSKFSAAWRSRAMSATCSSPNRSASASSEAMLLLRSSSCQVSIRQILGIDHQIVTGRVIPRDGCGPGVAACLVKPPRGLVVRPRACFYDHEPRAVRPKPRLHFAQQLRSDTGALALACDDDPVQVPCGFRAGRGAPAGITLKLFSLPLERADEPIVVAAAFPQARVEQLDRGSDLFLAEETGPARQLLKPCAVRAPDGAQRAAHGRPSLPAPVAARLRRCGGSARRTPTPPPSPCATARRRLSGRDWDSLRAPRRGPPRRPAGPPVRSPSPASSATPPRPAG